MTVWIVLALAITLFYCLLFVAYRLAWDKINTFFLETSFEPKTKISIVISARNEAANIEKCVQSLLAQNYPTSLYDIIIVNDFSEDNTLELLLQIQAPNLRILSMEDFVSKSDKIISFKKRAISIAIEHSDAELIVATDADCTVSPNWLANIVSFYQINQKPKMIVAPVRFLVSPTLLHQFQAIDFASMQGITAATVFLNWGIMCNGANLAFCRQSFWEVGAYDGVEHLISGDDYLLQYKFKSKWPGSVSYLKSTEAIVDTLPQNSWPAFFQQRIRWASKTGKYKDPKMTAILLLVYCFNFQIPILFFVACFNSIYWPFFYLILVAKIFAEQLLLWPISRFFAQRKTIILHTLLQPLHIIYIIVAGFLSRVAKFEWKNRMLQQP